MTTTQYTPVEPPTPRTTFTISVYVTFTWATGAPRRTGYRTFQIEEESSILGGMRAVDAAVERCGGHDLCEVASPRIEPNPAVLRWPIGTDGAPAVRS